MASAKIVEFILKENILKKTRDQKHILGTQINLKMLKNQK